MLAAVFAAASATSVVDHLQHEARIAHEHGAHLTLASMDHHEVRGSASEREHDGDHENDGAPADHAPGAGHHHHADAPVAALGGGLKVGGARFADVRTPPQPSDPNTKGVRPGGLERPPKPLAILV